MRVELRRDSISIQWVVGVLDGAHNHPPSTASTAHPAHRIAALAAIIRAEIGRLSRAGFPPGQILTTLRISDSQTSLIAKDIGNIVQQIRVEELNRRTTIRWLLEVSIKLF
jgi:hypothetical protein